MEGGWDGDDLAEPDRVAGDFGSAGGGFPGGFVEGDSFAVGEVAGVADPGAFGKLSERGEAGHDLLGGGRQGSVGFGGFLGRFRRRGGRGESGKAESDGQG